jgi:hypothetical protein
MEGTPCSLGVAAGVYGRIVFGEVWLACGDTCMHGVAIPARPCLYTRRVGNACWFSVGTIHMYVYDDAYGFALVVCAVQTSEAHVNQDYARVHDMQQLV